MLFSVDFPFAVTVPLARPWLLNYRIYHRPCGTCNWSPGLIVIPKGGMMLECIDIRRILHGGVLGSTNQ